MTETLGGLILKTNPGSMCFVEANQVTSIVTLGPITLVPDMPEPCMGIALANNQVVTVWRIGSYESQQPVPLCEIRGERLVLWGSEIVSFGFFEIVNKYAVVDSKLVRILDVMELFHQLEAQLWQRKTSRSQRPSFRQHDTSSASPPTNDSDDSLKPWPHTKEQP
jgi:hypothetical protein